MSEPSLNREQVDRLLELVADGALDLEEGPAQLYPPRQVDLGAVQGDVERWLEDAARRLENWMVIHVADTLRCASAGLVPRAGQLGSPPAGLALLGCSGGQDPLLSVWDRGLVDALVSGMLGGVVSANGAAEAAERTLTEIDLRMMRRAAAGLARALSRAWPRETERVFGVEALAADPSALPGGSAPPPSMAARFRIGLVDQPLGGIEFRMPGWIARDLRTETKSPTQQRRGNPEMREALGSLEVDVDVEIHAGTFTLKQILALKAGDEMALPAPPRAVLQAGDTPYAIGIPGSIEGRWAVAIAPPAEGDDDGRQDG